MQPFLRSCDITLAALNGTEKVGHELQSDGLSARLLFKLIDVQFFVSVNQLLLWSQKSPRLLSLKKEKT